MPAVSVVIPAYNRREFVSLAVESVLAQTYRDLEVIVVDDGSTDGTSDMLDAQFGERIRRERLPHNQGRSTARNTGWALAQGEFVAFLDSDDVWLPDKLARQMPLFERPEVALVHSWVSEMDVDGQLLTAESEGLRQAFVQAARRGYDYGGITETWCRMYTSSVVVRRDLLRRTGGFDARLWNFEDWDLLWRIARDGQVRTVEEALVWHRTHAGNTPTVWTTDAVPWLAFTRKHCAELAVHPNRRKMRRAQRNLYVNMSLGEYWRGRSAASRWWMWCALATDGGLWKRDNFYARGAPLLHSCLPAPLARYLVRRWGADNYGRERLAPSREVTMAVDDGPSDSTPELLSCLEAAGHRAVLFILGCNVEGREQVLVDAVTRGFALGNHSFLHPQFSAISIEEARESIEQTEELIERVYALAGVPRPGKWFRFPYLDDGGERGPDFQNVLAELGFRCPRSIAKRIPKQERARLDWPTTLSTLDYQLPSESEMRERVRKARPGDIIEFHDKPETVGHYIAVLIEELARRSLRGTVPSDIQ